MGGWSGWSVPDVYVYLLTPAEAVAELGCDDLFFASPDDHPFPDVHPGEVLLLWSDGNGNFAGIPADPDLGGFVAWWDHEEAWLHPRWASIDSFHRTVMAHIDARPDDDFGDPVPADFGSLPSDFPRAADALGDEWDRIARRLYALHAAHPESKVGSGAAWQALLLSSPALIDEVRVRLRSDELGVQDYAVEVLEHWGQLSREELTDLSEHHNHGWKVSQLLWQWSVDTVGEEPPNH